VIVSHNGKAILVVGGAGYIGSHMVHSLIDAGYRVVVFDNLSRGHAEIVSAPLVLGDLGSLSDIDKCFKNHSIDLVMHFAALAYVGESVSQPELYYQNNVIGTLNLLKIMRQHNVDKLVFSSSCATYGEPENTPINEHQSQRPINPYGRTKLMVEEILRDYGNAYGFKSTIMRYFNAAGCDTKGRVGEWHEPETHIIPLVLAEAQRLKRGGLPGETSLKVYGGNFPTFDGSCVRDFIHVNDICEAHLLAAQQLLAGRIESTEAFNLANGNGFSVFQVIDVCREVTGQPIAYRLAPNRQGDPSVLVGDAKKAFEVLNWRPKIRDLKEIIKTAWLWTENNDQPSDC